MTMFYIKNTQEEVEDVDIEGFEEQVYDSTNLIYQPGDYHSGTYCYIVKIKSTGKLKILPVDERISLEPENCEGEFNDYVIWCFNCHSFVGWFNSVDYCMPVCDKCNSEEKFFENQLREEYVNCYINATKYFAFNNEMPWSNAIENSHKAKAIVSYLQYYAREYFNVIIEISQVIEDRNYKD